MLEAVRDLRELYLRRIRQPLLDSIRLCDERVVDSVKVPEFSAAQSALRLAQAEIVGPDPINVDIDRAHGRNPVSLSFVRKGSHTVMPQSGN